MINTPIIEPVANKEVDSSYNFQEALNKVIKRVQDYNVHLEEGSPIILHVDGLCENPGAMHIGLWAIQGDRCLFAEHMYVGHGTCNEAEYIALKSGLLIIQSCFPNLGITAISAPVDANDFVRLSAIVAKLKVANATTTSWLRNQLSAATVSAMQTFSSTTDTASMTNLLITDFNHLIQGPCIYDADVFANVVSRVQASVLTGYHADYSRINRVLLEDALPELGRKNPIEAYSDSQLVTKQVAGTWHASDKMLTYCMFLRKLRKYYPYGLSKVKRQDNEMADSLAQKYILKNSGRCLTIDQGRFNSIKQVPAAMKCNNVFKAVLSKEYLDHLNHFKLTQDLQNMVKVANNGDTDEALELADNLLKKAESLFHSAPKTNAMGAIWQNNALEILRKSIELCKGYINQGNDINLQYIYEEIAGVDCNESELYSTQADILREGIFQLQACDYANQGETDGNSADSF